jgi:two-component system, sensor histidine kinase and response regulator
MVVTIASNGQECLDALHNSSYDLIFMDIPMPVMDGLEATRRIRRNSQFREVPIIAMTAHAMTGDREKSLAAGMNGHISKPIDPIILYQTLQEWIPVKQPDELQQKSRQTFSTAVPDDVTLPPLPGIDQEEALKTLNYNKQLFIKMLYNFKKSYSSLPTLLRELSDARKFWEIQEKAHTVKGIAGYIGSSLLMKTAQELEDTLKNDQQADVTNHLAFFISALDEILSSLSALPLLNEDILIRDKKSPGRDIRGIEVQQTMPMLIGQLGTEAENSIRVLIEQLKKGELAAEEQFTEVLQLLSETGFDRQLKTIAEFIDDIEYERAAEMAGDLLNMVQQKREN